MSLGRETKADSLLGLEEGWKNWLPPPDQPKSGNTALQDNSVEFNVVKVELKEEKGTITLGDKSFIDSLMNEGIDPTVTSIQNKEFQYETTSVKNYSTKSIRENPVDDVTKIFIEDTFLYEKQKFHQEILNKVVESTSQNKFEELQTLYIKYLHKAADLDIFKCLKCDFQTIHISNIKSHLLLVHKKDMESNMFKCTMCIYKVKNLMSLKKHQLDVHLNNGSSDSYSIDIEMEASDNESLTDTKKTKMTKCDLCGLSCHKQALHKHKLSHKCAQDPKKFVCYVCDYKNICKSNLKTHLLKVHDIKTTGREKFEEIKSLKGHLKRHKNSDMMEEWLKCSMCNYMTKHKKSLKNHLETHKPAEEQDRKYMCEICSSRLKTKAGLEFHMLRHKPIEEVKEIFNCHQCKYQTKFKSNLKIHMEVHRAPTFVCDVCGVQSRRKWNHEMHLLTHKNEHEVAIFNCALCPYKTKFKDRLKRHLTRGTHLEVVKVKKKQIRRLKNKSVNVEHVRRKNVKCSICDFETFSRKDYCKHMVKHTAQGERVEKTYSCETCGFKTFYSSSFSTHLKSHKSLEEVQMFQCPDCNFKTRLKGNLKKHMNIHKDPSELKTFKCDVCGIQLTRKENLTVHMLLHKGPEETEILKCSLCSYQSKIRAYMQVHLKKTHKIVTRRNEYRNYCSVLSRQFTENDV